MKPIFRLAILVGLCFALSCKESHHAPVNHTVLIQGMKFQPGLITVELGDSITWINKDIVAHNIVALPDSAWRSNILPSGASWTLVPKKSSDYYCSIHVVMKGKIEVK
jgi:plastocyanin